MEIQDSAGQVQDQIVDDANLPIEDEHLDDNPDSSGDGQWRQTFEARMDLMSQGLDRLNQTLASLGQRPVTQEQFEVEMGGDDDEPLTPNKVAKIVNHAVDSAVKRTSAKSEREQWDAKVRSEFPIKDPKFEAEFNRQWASFRDAGGNINHPKAVYKVCSDVARAVGKATPPARRAAASEHVSGEPPAGSTRDSSAPGRRKAASKISDDDPRLEFMRLRTSDPAKVQKFKESLEAKEVAKNSRRRTRA